MDGDVKVIVDSSKVDTSKIGGTLDGDVKVTANSSKDSIGKTSHM